MKTYLVTGAAGFIGANYIKYLLHKKYVNEDIKIIVLDALTYAGNLGTIKDDIDDKRCFFVKGDIRDRELIDKLFAENDIDYLVNFAAESHVDRSIEDPQLFLSVNILGTQNLMERCSPCMGYGQRRNRATLRGKKENVTIRCLPNEVYGSLGAEGYLPKKLHYALTAHIRQVKPVPICLLWHTTIRTTCPSALHVALTTMVLTTSPKS